MRGAIRILGIDPGLRRTGWGVIAVAGNALSYVDSGSLKTGERETLAARLLVIHNGLREVVDERQLLELASLLLQLLRLLGQSLLVLFLARDVPRDAEHPYNTTVPITERNLRGGDPRLMSVFPRLVFLDRDERLADGSGADDVDDVFVGHAAADCSSAGGEGRSARKTGVSQSFGPGRFQAPKTRNAADAAYSGS